MQTVRHEERPRPISLEVHQALGKRPGLASVLVEAPDGRRTFGLGEHEEVEQPPSDVSREPRKGGTDHSLGLVGVDSA